MYGAKHSGKLNRVRRFCLAFVCMALGCSSGRNNLHYCANAAALRPELADLVCAPGEELFRDEAPAWAAQQCRPPDSDAVCAANYPRHPPPPWLLEQCRAASSTQSLYVEYCEDGVQYLERTARAAERVEIEIVNDRGAGHAHASFPARCAMGRMACGPGEIEYVRDGVTWLSGAYGATGHPDGQWIVRGRRGVAQFSLQNGDGTIGNVLGIDELTCKNGLLDGSLRLRDRSRGQMDVLVEAQFRDGRANGPFQMKIKNDANEFDLVQGQYADGFPTGGWFVESHGTECARHEGDCDIVCAEYVRNGPALYVYRESERLFVRNAGAVAESFRSMRRADGVALGPEDLAEPSIHLESIPPSPITCMSVIAAMADSDSPGTRIELVRDGAASAMELTRMLQSARGCLTTSPLRICPP